MLPEDILAEGVFDGLEAQAIQAEKDKKEAEQKAQAALGAFGILPSELIVRVISQLSHHDVLEVRKVNQSFLSYADIALLDSDKIQKKHVDETPIIKKSFVDKKEFRDETQKRIKSLKDMIEGFNKQIEEANLALNEETTKNFTKDWSKRRPEILALKKDIDDAITESVKIFEKTLSLDLTKLKKLIDKINLEPNKDRHFPLSPVRIKKNTATHPASSLITFACLMVCMGLFSLMIYTANKVAHSKNDDLPISGNVTLDNSTSTGSTPFDGRHLTNHDDPLLAPVLSGTFMFISGIFALIGASGIFGRGPFQAADFKPYKDYEIKYLNPKHKILLKEILKSFSSQFEGKKFNSIGELKVHLEKIWTESYEKQELVQNLKALQAKLIGFIHKNNYLIDISDAKTDKTLVSVKRWESYQDDSKSLKESTSQLMGKYGNWKATVESQKVVEERVANVDPDDDQSMELQEITVDKQPLLKSARSSLNMVNGY